MSVVPPVSRQTERKLAIGVLAFLAMLTMLRIASTWTLFSQVIDEPAHIAAGMEWLQHGSYTFEMQHPPIARIATALGLYLDGARLPASTAHMVYEGNELLLHDGRYERNLALARAGTLPFFLLSVLVLYLYTRRIAGENIAALATALYLLTPTVVAHAGFATTDMAGAATFLLAVHCAGTYFDAPGVKRAVALGASAALALMCKFSALLFLPLALIALLLVRRILRPASAPPPEQPEKSQRGRDLLLGCLALFLVIWGSYRFSFSTLSATGPDASAFITPHVPEQGPARQAVYGFADRVPLPAPEFPLGVSQLQLHNRAGHVGYLFGQQSARGWWYYFPVALVHKTPLPLLLFWIVGVAAALTTWRERPELLEPLLVFAVIIGSAMTSGINIGVRHILAALPFFAITAADGVRMIWTAGRFREAARTVACVLLLWILTASVTAHPDAIAYFNELAGGRGDLVLQDSNLDWGQDLLRLRSSAERHQIRSLRIAYFGSLDPSRIGLPQVQSLEPFVPVSGWIAISEMHLKGVGQPVERRNAYSWLRVYRPIEQIGRSMWLYHIPEPAIFRSR